jgi:hypothetical protein
MPPTRIRRVDVLGSGRAQRFSANSAPVAAAANKFHRLLSGAMSSTLCHSAQLGHHSQSFSLVGLLLASGSCLRHDLAYPAKSRLVMPKSRGRKPKKNRAQSPAAPRMPPNNLNNTPQISSPSMLTFQEPQPAAAAHRERPASKIKQVAMALWRWLRTIG